MFDNKVVWITWEDPRRNRGIADYISAKLFEFPEIHRHGKNLLFKYGEALFKTFRTINKEKPKVLIVQNPSVVLALASIVAQPIFGYKLGVDTHNIGLYYEGPKWLRWIKMIIQRTASFIIVHNQGAKDIIRHIGGNIIALPDRLPELRNNPDIAEKLKQKYPELTTNICYLYITTFADDDPYTSALDGIKAFVERTEQKTTFFVTGDFARAKTDVKVRYSNDNIIFLGRIPWEEYDELIKIVEWTIVLSNRENNLQCGCYESIAAGTPVITASTPITRDYFNKAVHTNISCYSFSLTLNKTIGMARDIATHNIFVHREELIELWEKRWVPKLIEEVKDT